jgi:hypothetical protein
MLCSCLPNLSDPDHSDSNASPDSHHIPGHIWDTAGNTLRTELASGLTAPHHEPRDSEPLLPGDRIWPRIRAPEFLLGHQPPIAATIDVLAVSKKHLLPSVQSPGKTRSKGTDDRSPQSAPPSRMSLRNPRELRQGALSPFWPSSIGSTDERIEGGPEHLRGFRRENCPLATSDRAEPFPLPSGHLPFF